MDDFDVFFLDEDEEEEEDEEGLFCKGTEAGERETESRIVSAFVIFSMRSLLTYWALSLMVRFVSLLLEEE